MNKQQCIICEVQDEYPTTTVPRDVLEQRTNKTFTNETVTVHQECLIAIGDSASDCGVCPSCVDEKSCEVKLFST